MTIHFQWDGFVSVIDLTLDTDDEDDECEKDANYSVESELSSEVSSTSEYDQEQEQTQSESDTKKAEASATNCGGCRNCLNSLIEMDQEYKQRVLLWRKTAFTWHKIRMATLHQK